MFWRLPCHILGFVYCGIFLNFLGARAVIVLFVKILFHKSGLWSCPIRSNFCSYISCRQFAVCFFWSRSFVRRMSMALTIFRDFRSVAGTTALCAPADVLTALLPGSARFESVQGVFGASWMFFFGRKMLNFCIFGFPKFR